MWRIGLPEGALCQLQRAEARCAGVVRTRVVLEARCAGMVRTPVVRIARCAGVVRRLVLLFARSRQRDRVLGVVPCKAYCARRAIRWAWFQPNARCAGRDRMLGVIPCLCGSTERPLCRVVPCRGGAVMRTTTQNDEPARRTMRSSRPLRAQDRWVFNTLSVVRARPAEHNRSAVGECGRQPVSYL